MRLGDHVDFAAIAHAGLFEPSAEAAVDQANGREILHAAETKAHDLVQEDIHLPERVGAADTGEHRRAGDDRQHFARHLDDDPLASPYGIMPASEPRPAMR